MQDDIGRRGEKLETRWKGMYLVEINRKGKERGTVKRERKKGTGHEEYVLLLPPLKFLVLLSL